MYRPLGYVIDLALKQWTATFVSFFILDTEVTDQNMNLRTAGCKFPSRQWEFQYNWLYFNNRTNRHHCKICEAWFPSSKWASEPSKLGDHPRRICLSHQQSDKHQQAVKSMKIVQKCKKRETYLHK